MDIRVVQSPGAPPNACSVCGLSAGDGVGPFVEYGVQLTIKTANGPVPTEHWIALCVGNADRPGCIVDGIRAVGGLGPGDVRRQNVSHEDEKARLYERIAQLEEQPPALKVVSIDDLPAVLAAAGHTDAA